MLPKPSLIQFSLIGNRQFDHLKEKKELHISIILKTIHIIMFKIMFNISIAQISIWIWSNALYNSRGNQINIMTIIDIIIIISSLSRSLPGEQVSNQVSTQYFRPSMGWTNDLFNGVNSFEIETKKVSNYNLHNFCLSPYFLSFFLSHARSSQPYHSTLKTKGLNQSTSEHVYNTIWSKLTYKIFQCIHKDFLQIPEFQ